MTYNPISDPSLRAEHPFTFSAELRDAFATRRLYGFKQDSGPEAPGAEAVLPEAELLPLEN